jgi:TolB protein
MPTSGTVGGTSLSFGDFQFSSSSVGSLSAASLAGFDTLVLLQVNTAEFSSQQKADINAFVDAGSKLVIYDSDGTSGEDYSWLLRSFSTSPPCPNCGLTGGSLSIVEDNTLSSTNPASPYYINTAEIPPITDAVGDANVLATLDSHWFGDMQATNGRGQTGWTHTYAASPSGAGLLIYNGLDTDYIGSTFYPSGIDWLGKIWYQELKQQWDPSGLPSSVPLAGKIAFTTDRDGNYQIYAMNPDGSGQTRLSNNGFSDKWPHWSADGTKFAFGRSDTDVYKMNADGTGQTQLTFVNSFATDPGSWSPDGTKIAFYSDFEGGSGNEEIYTMNADGTGVTRLTNMAGADRGPSWSPDGTKIAFCRDAFGGQGIDVMNADGTGLVNIDSANDCGPDWSPDGTKIAFTRGGFDAAEIYVMNADGSGATRLTNNGSTDESPSWSPDGTKIVFASYRDGNGEIYVMNADGTGQTRLTNNAAVDEAPDWQPGASSATLTVNKNFSDNSSASVNVSVTCTNGGTPSPASGTVSHAAPRTYTITGFTTGATCTATETVPAGYTATSNCTNVAISNGGAASCTITNTPSPTGGSVGGIGEFPLVNAAPEQSAPSGDNFAPLAIGGASAAALVAIGAVWVLRRQSATR